MIFAAAVVFVLQQDPDKGLRRASESMDRSVDHLHKAGRGEGVSQLDRSIRRQKEALEAIDEMLKELRKGGS